jgi:hypothetical protein
VEEDGVLNTIHRRWLERTANGDSALIIQQFNQQTGFGVLDDDARIALFDGYVARVGAENISEDGGEYSAYLVGRGAVRAFIESNPEEVTVTRVIETIKAAYRSDKPVEETTGSNGWIPVQAASKPPIKRVKRVYGHLSPDLSVEDQRRRGTEISSQKKRDMKEIRLGMLQGEISLGEALDSPVIEKMMICDILIRVPRVGDVKLRKALKDVGLAGETEIGALTEEQKNQLAEMFPQHKHQPNKRRKFVNERQSKESLEKANATRQHHADVKLKLAAGKIKVDEVFDDPIGARMKLRQVLIKLPTRASSPQRVKSRELMAVVLDATGLDGSKRLNEMTEKQKQILLDDLASRYKPDTGTYRFLRPHKEMRERYLS